MILRKQRPSSCFFPESVKSLMASFVLSLPQRRAGGRHPLPCSRETPLDSCEHGTVFPGQKRELEYNGDTSQRHLSIDPLELSEPYLPHSAGLIVRGKSDSSRNSERSQTLS